MKGRTATVGVALALALVAALIVSAAGSASRNASFKMAIVTDIGSIQDRSFNQLANQGRLAVARGAQDSDPRLPDDVGGGANSEHARGLQGRVQHDLPRRLPQLQRRECRRSEMLESPVGRGGHLVRAAEGEAEERGGHRLRRAGSRLSRRLPRGARGQEPGRSADHQRRRCEPRPGNRPLHQRLYPGGQAGEPEGQGSRRLRERPDLLRSGEVQGDALWARSSRGHARSSRSRVSADSARCRPPRRRTTSGASASTPTSSTSARSC